MAYASNERWLLLFALSLAACQGDRAPPLLGGDGVRVTASDAVRISIDPDRVPLVDTCGDGELVLRASGGWACAPPATVFAAVPMEQQPVAPAVITTLTERVSAVEAQVQGLERCGELPPAVRPPNYVIAPASCLVVTSTAGRNDNYYLENGWLVMSKPGRINVYCALLPRCDGSDRRWDRAQFLVRDPDGAGAEEAVEVEVRESFNVRIPNCNPPDSNCVQTSARAGSSTLTIELGGYVPSFANEPGLQHYVGVEIRSGRRSGDRAAFGGVIIE